VSFTFPRFLPYLTVEDFCTDKDISRGITGLSPQKSPSYDDLFQKFPAIGFIAETVFHLVPLAVFTLLLRFIPASVIRKATSRTWIALLLAALAEPLFQVVLLHFSSTYDTGVLLFVGIHVYLFSLVQLILFRRWGFTAMFAMRLAYYFIWHIAWGWIRIGLRY